jgi:hypothetical protein
LKGIKMKTTASGVPIGIFNPAIKSNWPYLQHICPKCRKVNGENTTAVFVTCDCGLTYQTPTGMEVVEFRNAEHAALVAVAEAAKLIRLTLEPIPDIPLKDGCLCAGCGAWRPKGHKEAHDHEDDCPEVRKRTALFGQQSHDQRHYKRLLDEALANLAAVRKGAA